MKLVFVLRNIITLIQIRRSEENSVLPSLIALVDQFEWSRHLHFYTRSFRCKFLPLIRKLIRFFASFDPLNRFQWRKNQMNFVLRLAPWVGYVMRLFTRLQYTVLVSENGKNDARNRSPWFTLFSDSREQSRRFYSVVSGSFFPTDCQLERWLIVRETSLL